MVRVTTRGSSPKNSLRCAASASRCWSSFPSMSRKKRAAAGVLCSRGTGLQYPRRERDSLSRAARDRLGPPLEEATVAWGYSTPNCSSSTGRPSLRT